jgi:hypothetical protein
LSENKHEEYKLIVLEELLPFPLDHLTQALQGVDDNIYWV